MSIKDTKPNTPDTLPSFGTWTDSEPPTIPEAIKKNLNFFTKDTLRMRGYGAPEQTPVSNRVSSELYNILKNHRREIDYITTSYAKVPGAPGLFGDKVLFAREKLYDKGPGIAKEELGSWVEHLKNLPGATPNSVAVDTTSDPLGSFVATGWQNSPQDRRGFKRLTVIPSANANMGRAITAHETAHHFDPILPYAVYRAVERPFGVARPNVEAELPAMMAGLAGLKQTPETATEKYISKLAPKLKHDSTDPVVIRKWMNELRAGGGTQTRKYKELANALYLIDKGLPVEEMLKPRSAPVEGALRIKEFFYDVGKDPKKLALALALTGVTAGAGYKLYKNRQEKKRRKAGEDPEDR